MAEITIIKKFFTILKHWNIINYRATVYTLDVDVYIARFGKERNIYIYILINPVFHNVIFRILKRKCWNIQKTGMSTFLHITSRV